MTAGKIQDLAYLFQTHLNETLQEIETVMELHPGHKTYSDVYDAAGLLSPKVG